MAKLKKTSPKKRKLRLKRAKRKGMIEVQFNWIFVLIAGALILAFFFSVIQKQRAISGQKIALSLLNDFETIATGALQAKDTVQTVQLPDLSIEFVCSDECTCSFSIGGLDRDFRDKIIFSPKTIKGSEISVWTLDWNIPFRVSNFLYLTNRNIQFFLIYEEGNADSERLLNILERRLPDDINFESVKLSEVSSLTDENYLKAKFIYLSIDESQLSSINLDSFENADPSVLIVNPLTKELSFFEKKSQKSDSFDDVLDSFYSNDEDLLGAIFADDFNNYECNMKKAFTKATYVSEIYKARTETFASEPTLSSCPYSTLQLKTIITQVKSLKFDIVSLSTLNNAASSLAETNEQLLRKSCPTIY